MDALTYLESQCRLRRNVLTGETLYAPTDMAEYKPLSVEAQNTLLLMANSQGVDLSEEQLQQYIHSTIIEQWNPAKSWMESLEPWDGNDYVEELAQRIIDFSSGSCYAIGGGLQKVSSYIFILTPSNVEISGDIQDLLNGAVPSMRTSF